MSPRPVIALFAAVGLLAAAACTSGPPIRAVPPVTAQVSAPTLASIQPCALLTSDDGLGYTVGDDVRDTQGLADINADGYSVSNDPVGHHQGKLAQQTNGDGCFVAIGVGPSSRVDVVVSTSSADVHQSCELANRFARLIEPKLP